MSLEQRELTEAARAYADAVAALVDGHPFSVTLCNDAEQRLLEAAVAAYPRGGEIVAEVTP